MWVSVVGGNNGVTCGLDEDVKGVLAARGAGGKSAGLWRRRTSGSATSVATGVRVAGPRPEGVVLRGHRGCPRPSAPTRVTRALHPHPGPGSGSRHRHGQRCRAPALSRFSLTAWATRPAGSGSTARDEHWVEGPAPTPREAGGGAEDGDTMTYDPKNFRTPGFEKFHVCGSAVVA